MARTAQWRTRGQFDDAVLALDDSGTVCEAFTASQQVLSRLLTQLREGELETWRGDAPVGLDERDPDAWGQLVIARAGIGEVLEVEPELFWHGIYLWFRSRGVDYDSPDLDQDSSWDDAPKLQRSSIMDD